MSEINHLHGIIRGLLPINDQGGCFYCSCGSNPDADLRHFDVNNLWGGDQKCLWHDDYRDARDALGINGRGNGACNLRLKRAYQELKECQ